MTTLAPGSGLVSSFFRNNKSHASIFDLLDGKQETKQTMALGWLLNNDPVILQRFLELPCVRALGMCTRLKNLARLSVHIELTAKGKGKQRIDIALLFEEAGSSKEALLIEAKSATTGVKYGKVLKQLSGYMSSSGFPELQGYKKYGCILTTMSTPKPKPNIASLSWNDIYSILADEKASSLAKEFLNFMQRMNGTMKFYDKEVLSIPAGNSYEMIAEEPHIYDRPADQKGYELNSKPLYVAFRQRDGGKMERLYGIDQIIAFKPSIELQNFLVDEGYDKSVRDRIAYYCEQRGLEGEKQLKKFFVLSDSNQIPLPHKPRPERNNAKHAYYTLAEILDHDNKILKKRSLQQKSCSSGSCGGGKMSNTV